MIHGTFEITFYPGIRDLSPGAAAPAEYPVTATYRSPNSFNGPQARGTVAINPDALLGAALDPRAYGRALGEALFYGPIRDLFLFALADTNPLHVLLSLEAPSLRRYNWERLCAPLDGGWEFLGLRQNTPLTIYVAGATDRRFPPVGYGALRALVVVASPTGVKEEAPTFPVGPSAAAVLGGLVEAPPPGVQVTLLARGVDGAVGPPTLDELFTRLGADAFTVLHLVCHGAFAADAADFCLYLEDDAGGVRRVPGGAFIRRLQLLDPRRVPYLTFLSACESAVGRGAHDRFAQALARGLGLPAVVGMAEAVSVATAGTFARRFYRHLRHHGHPDLALADARTGLIDSDDVLVPVLISQLGGRPLFDASLDDAQPGAEAVAAALALLETELARRAPAALPQLRALAAAFRASAPDDHGADAPFAELNNLSDEILEVSFSALCAGAKPPAYAADVCPFNGMKAFDYARREFFKGREDLIAKLAERLKAGGALAVVGPSGSGKSSAVFAGVLPALEVAADGFVSFAPGSNPLGAFVAALAGARVPDAILVVDQFEELFTHSMKDEVRTAFIERLHEEKVRRRVVVTLRSEFRDRLRGTWLWDLVSDPVWDVQPMPATDLRRAMEEQATEVGLRFEANLVPLILEDIADEPGRMPLLQHTLRELWLRRRGQWLKTDEYRALGGVHRAVTATADAFVGELKDEERRRATDLFLRLTRVADETDATNQTRRRVRIADLVPAGEDERPTRELLQRATDRYLVVTSGADAEVAHEALIRHWGTLGEWVSRHRPAVAVRQTLSASALAWEQSGRGSDGLMHRGSRLTAAEGLRADPVLRLNRVEEDYLAACRRWEQRNRVYRSAGFVLAGVLLTVMVGGLLHNARAEAKREADDAIKKAKDEAEANARDKIRDARESDLRDQQAKTARRERWERYSNVVKAAAVLGADHPVKAAAGLNEFAGDAGTELRGFEWHHLMAVTRSKTIGLGTFEQRDGRLPALVYAAGSNALLEHSPEGVRFRTVRLAEKGDWKPIPIAKPLRVAAALDKPVVAVATPDGIRIVGLGATEPTVSDAVLRPNGPPRVLGFLALSADGTLLAACYTAMPGHVLTVWDLKTTPAKVLADGVGLAALVRQFRFDVDENLVALVSTSGAAGTADRLDVINPRTGIASQTRPLGQRFLSTHAVLSPRGDMVALVTTDRKVEVCKVSGFARPGDKPILPSGFEPSRLAFAEDGGPYLCVLAPGADQEMFAARWYRTEGGKVESTHYAVPELGWHESGSGPSIRRWVGLSPTPGFPHLIWAGPDRQLLAVGEPPDDRSELVLQPDTKSENKRPSRQTDDIAFAPSGRFAVVTTSRLEDGEARDAIAAHVYDVRSGKVHATLVPRAKDDLSIGLWAVDDAGALLAVSDGDAGVRLFSARGERLPTPQFASPPVGRVRFRPGKRQLAGIEQPDGATPVALWDVDQKKMVARFTPPGDERVDWFEFTPDGEHLVAITDAAFYVWRVSDPSRPRTREPLSVRPPHNEDNSTVYALRPTGDNRHAVLVYEEPLDEDGKAGRTVISVRNLETGKEVARRAWPGAVSVAGPKFALDPSGRRVAFAFGKSVTLIDLGRWDDPDWQPQELVNLPAGARVSEVAFGPDGRTLVGVLKDGTIRLWRAPER